MSFMSLIQNKMMSAWSLFQMIKHGWAILSHCKRIYVNMIMRTRGNETAENNSYIDFLARLSPQRSRTALISHLLICSAAEPQTQLYKKIYIYIPPPLPSNNNKNNNNKKRKKEKKKRNVDIHFNPNCLLLISLLFLLPFHDASTHSCFSVLNELL